MQRHRHNAKVSKLLVGLGPYQAYTNDTHARIAERYVSVQSYRTGWARDVHRVAVVGPDLPREPSDC